LIVWEREVRALRLDHEIMRSRDHEIMMSS
jgi:hypothetical protein